MSASESPSLSASRPEPTDLLVGASAIAAALWCADRLAAGADWPMAVLPLALSGGSAAFAWWLRRRVGTRARNALVPAWYLLVVLAATAAITLTWWLVDGSASGIQAGLSAVIASGPAAFSVVGVLSIWAGNRIAAADGIRFPDLRTLDALARIDTLVMNAVGTVTTGRLRVLSADPFDPTHVRNLQWFAGALAHAWPDPLAQALTASTGRGRLSDVEVIDGVGIRGSVDRHPVRVGAPAWIGVPAPETIWSSVGVEVDGRALGTVTVADDVRADAPEAIQRLIDLGISPVLVADRGEAATEHIADAAGISTWHPWTPHESHPEVVQQLVDQQRVVATAGDVGAPAAVHLRGTDATGDPGVELEDVGVAKVVKAVELGRATRHRARRAIALTLLISVAGLVAAGTALIGPLGAAGFALAGSVIAVVVATT